MCSAARLAPAESRADAGDRPGSEPYRMAWNRHIARSARAHGLVPVYWDNGVTGQHGMGLFDRRTGAPVERDLIRAIVDAMS